jgi:hypothetical protein
MLKVLKFITTALGNVHTLNAHIENAYEAWQGFYKFLGGLYVPTPEPAQAVVPAEPAEAVAAEPAEAKPAIALL